MAVWPLLFGIAMLTTSNGLQGTLLGLRASDEGFPIALIGIIMSVYYGGFLIACRYVPGFILSVGHVRVFAALASIASTSILLHGLFIDPWLWVLMRLVTGFCFCGLFIIAESWLNHIAPTKQRGLIFTAYIGIVNAGIFAGQFLINLAPLNSMHLFVLISIMISLALAPITLTNKPTPRSKKPETIPFLTMILKYPIPMTGVFVSGISSGTMIGLGPVYAKEIGFSTHEISIFMGMMILGNAVLPMVLGAISDKIDRRIVIMASAGIAVLSAISLSIDHHYHIPIFILGGMIASLYGVSISYLNDQIKKNQIVSASRSLILFNAIGATLGPIIGGLLLSYIGVSSFFISIAVYMSIMLILAIYRNIFGNRVKKRKDFVQVPVYAAPSVMRLQQDMPKTPQIDMKAEHYVQSPSRQTEEKKEDKSA